MKKILFIILVSIYSFSFSQENQLNIGLNGGVPIGNIKQVSSFALGLEANYLFEVSEDFHVGPSLGFIFFSTKKVDGEVLDPFMYLPVGGALRFHTPEDDFFVGGDVGFAVGISPNGDRGGIFFKPMVGYNISRSLQLNLFYAGVKKKEPTYSYIGLGIAFDLYGSKYSYY